MLEIFVITMPTSYGEDTYATTKLLGQAAATMEHHLVYTECDAASPGAGALRSHVVRATCSEPRQDLNVWHDLPAAFREMVRKCAGAHVCEEIALLGERHVALG